jgi:hypothetical protein
MNSESGAGGCLSLASGQRLGGGKRPKLAPSIYPVAGRSPELNARIAAHESGHAFAARALGTVLHSVSIIPGNGFEGRCRSIGYQSQLYEKPEHETVAIVALCERAQRLTPELGVNRVESAEFFQRATVLAIELCAGSVAETILHPHEEPLPTSHDQIEAAAFASLAVASPRAIPAFLEYCKAEAAALITDHLGAAKAIADALVERGELSGAEVDDIIAIGLAQKALDEEKARQRKWHAVEANAGMLALNQTGLRRGASRTFSHFLSQ